MLQLSGFKQSWLQDDKSKNLLTATLFTDQWTLVVNRNTLLLLRETPNETFSYFQITANNISKHAIWYGLAFFRVL